MINFNILIAGKAKNISQTTGVAEPCLKLGDYLARNKLNTQRVGNELSLLLYNTCPAAFVGRDEEFEKLYSFLDDERKVLWWSITGEGGSGKTRLAYEFLRKLQNKEWVGGFINWPYFEQELEKKSLYLDDKHYLIVIDYVYAYEEKIAQFIERIYAANYEKKIRILLIEREYKHLVSTNTKVITPWKEFFKDGFYTLSTMESTQYISTTLNLNKRKFEEEEIKEIVFTYCKGRNISITDNEIKHIISPILCNNKLNSNPLLIILATEYLLSHKQEISLDVYDSMVTYAVDKEMKNILKSIELSLNKQEKVYLKNLLMVATIVSDVDVTSGMDNLPFGADKKAEYKQLLDKMNKMQLLYSDRFGNMHIKGIQPDLVGEKFVYLTLKDYNTEEIKEIIGCILNIYPTETVRFLLRFIEDNRHYLIKDNTLDLYENFLPENRMVFTVVNDQGASIECEVLFTFESEENNKNYIVYTDNTVDEEGNTRVFASIYDPHTDQSKLLPIETEKEWRIIETILEELQQEAGESDMQKDITKITKQIEHKLNGQ